MSRLPAVAIPVSALVLGVPTALAPGSTAASVTYTSAFIAMVGFAWLGLRSRTGAAARAHALVAGGLTMWLAGDLLYDVLIWHYHRLGGVSAADVLWTAGYPLLAAGLVVMTRLRAPGRLRAGLLDGLAMATAVGSVVWQLMMLPAFDDGGVSLAAVVTAFYPFGDVLLFAAVAMLVLSPGDRGGPTRYLVAALALTLIGDVGIWVFQVAVPAFDPERLDGLLLFANSLLVAALRHPRADQLTRSHATEEERLHPARLVFLGVALTALPFLAILRGTGGAAERITLLVATTGLTVIVLIRFASVVRGQEQARAALAHRATHDQLTGLVNRQELHARLDAALRRRASPLGPVVHFIDLDGFKPVNDAYGHAVGDRVLCEVARRLEATARRQDTVARLGGDEFVVLCEDVDSPETAAAVAERLGHAVSLPVQHGAVQIRIGASVGTALAGLLDRPTADDLLVAADVQMYRAKTTRPRRAGDAAIEVAAQLRARMPG